MILGRGQQWHLPLPLPRGNSVYELVSIEHYYDLCG